MYLRNGWYYMDYYGRDGRRFRRALKTQDAEVARRRERELLKKIMALNPDGKELVFYADFKEWFCGYLDKNKSGSTKQIHLLALTYLEEFKKPIYLRDITPELLLDFKLFLFQKSLSNKGHPGPSGRNRNLRAIKTMMRVAEKLGKIGIKQNWEVVEPDKNEIEYRTEWHTVKELEEIAKALKDTGDLFTAFLLGWEEGLRKGEMAFLYKTDYNPINHTISISKKPEWRPKTKKSERTIPLRPDSERAIVQSIRRSPANSRYIINIPGDRNKSDYLSYLYIRTLKLRLPHIHSFLHKLRHTFGSLLVQSGVHLKVVADLMGHSSVSMTEKYVHLGQSEFVEAVQKMPKLNLY